MSTHLDANPCPDRSSPPAEGEPFEQADEEFFSKPLGLAELLTLAEQIRAARGPAKAEALGRAFEDPVLDGANLLETGSRRGDFVAAKSALGAAGVPMREWEKAREWRRKGQRDKAHQRVAEKLERSSPSTSQAELDALLEARGMRRAGSYVLTPEGLFLCNGVGFDTQGEARPVLGDQLTSFPARIVADCTELDGTSERRWYTVKATVRGVERIVEVPAEDFDGMKWVARNLGAEAVVYPGPGTRDHARAAIQLLSAPIPHETTYAITGWQKRNGRWVYVHAGGALGSEGPVEGVRVNLPTELRRFVLPPPPEGEALLEAVNAALALLDLDPSGVQVPLCAAAWRAPLGPTKVSIHLSAVPKTGKTLRTALVQQHYGAELDEDHPPATWASTAAFLNQVRGRVGDAVFFLDDLVFTGNRTDDAAIFRKAEAVFRNQFAGTGTGRLTRDARSNQETASRSLLCSTGEVQVRGPSLMSRVLFLRLGERGPDLGEHRRVAREGLYARAMSAYLCWLAPRMDEVRAELPDVVERIASKLGARCDDRTAKLVADLAAGLTFLLRFAEDKGVASHEKLEGLRARCWEAFLGVASAQGGPAREQDPARRFVTLIGSAIASARVHLQTPKRSAPKDPGGYGWRLTNAGAVDREGEPREPRWSAPGPMVGFLAERDGEDLVFLEPQVALVEARRFASDLDDPLPIPNTVELARRLDEGNLLVRLERRGDTRTSRLRVAPADRTQRGSFQEAPRFLCVKARVLGLGGVQELDDPLFVPEGASCGQGLPHGESSCDSE